MRSKRGSRGLWVACMCALMPPFTFRCSPPERPAPQGEWSGRLAKAPRRELIDELRELVAEHDALGHEGGGAAGPESAELEYHEATGRALERLEGAARAAAGPCASGRVVMAEVASFERLAGSLQSEFDRHHVLSGAGDGPPEGEERRHRAEALGLLDELERAYADVERDARHRAGVGCLWQGDV
ncbi:MAG TPA: hypothetical protein VFS00_35015 [Polyangiaceae bacterium]|nr:hypothetical protein [Polyangiaceae bacterium]